MTGRAAMPADEGKARRLASRLALAISIADNLKKFPGKAESRDYTNDGHAEIGTLVDCVGQVAVAELIRCRIFEQEIDVIPCGDEQDERYDAKGLNGGILQTTGLLPCSAPKDDAAP